MSTMLPSVLRLICLFSIGYAIAGERHRPAPVAVDDDYYYYEEDTTTPKAKNSDVDLAELVKAWKDYIKDKATPAPQPIIEYECPPREESYRIPSEEQCDKYVECNIKGEEKVKLCPDGLVFETKNEICDYPTKVNCSGRPLLQPAQATKNCPRANGFFAFPANESCQKFWDCREGKSYLQICPAAVIFDPFIDACTTPDQSNRPECAAGKFLGFECPQYGPEQELRFGNHERLASPDSCQQYFLCLRSGLPRLGACPKKTVFNNVTGHCAEPNTVPGCEHYWDDKEEKELAYDYS